MIHASCTGTGSGPRVLVFTRETVWTHASTPVARDAILAMCTTRGFSVTASADEKAFDRIWEFDVVVFAVTSGIVLDDRGRVELEAWIRAGGGVVGIHSASATEYEWPFFVQLIGARFRTHPPALLAADVTVEDAAHPIMAGIPARWNRTDEWYAYHDRPQDQGYHMLLALDEATVALPADQQKGFHPMAWTDDRLGGRMFYTAMGHTPESYAETAFLDMLANAITWTAAGP
jgi:type 1 glutamine amidotransferase